MTTTKTYTRILPAKKIISDEYLKLVTKAVLSTNELVREAYQFIKAFGIYRCENGLDILLIDRSFIKAVFWLLCNKKGKSITDLNIVNILTKFYDNHYNAVQIGKYTNPGKDILEAEIVQMVTSIDNHIKGHFYDYIRRLANSQIDNKVEKYKTKRPKLVKDLYDNTFKSEEQYHDLIKRFGPDIVEAKGNLKSDPQSSLELLFRINKEIQAKKLKTFSFLPLRSSLIPATIQLCKTICKSAFRKEKEMWDDISDKVNERFKLKSREYNFSSLRTDGIHCSLTFTSNIKVKKRDPIKESYIDELTDEEYLVLRKCNIVAGDPGKNNLIQLKDDKNKFLRYTAIQRKKETGATKYRAIRLKREKLATGETKDDEPEIKLNENLEQLKAFNSRTTKFSEFMLFVKEKNKFADRFLEHYREIYYRKFKFNTKINSARSKDKFLNRFKNTYGPPSSTVICIGDWEQRQGISFGKAPTIGVGIRNWFRSRNYRVYLIDEFRSSATCCRCHQENEYNFMTRPDPRPWKKNETQKIWGLSRCTNSKCMTVHSRDINASTNLHDIATNCIFGHEPLECFARKTRT